MYPHTTVCGENWSGLIIAIFLLGYFKPVPIPWGSSRHGWKNICASTAEEGVKRQKEAGSACKQLVTPAKYVQRFTPSKQKKANLHTEQNQNNLLYIYLEIETSSHWLKQAPILVQGARWDCANRHGEQKGLRGSDTIYLFWWLLAIWCSSAMAAKCLLLPSWHLRTVHRVRHHCTEAETRVATPEPELRKCFNLNIWHKALKMNLSPHHLENK